MKEILEIRINYDYASLLFRENEGKNLGTSIKLIKISKDDERYKKIPILQDQVLKKYNTQFFFGWNIERKYSKNELDNAELFYLKISRTFEPSGEEYGTLYDNSLACTFCSANRKQIGPLFLKRNSIPKNKDIAVTIGGEVVVSRRFIELVEKYDLKGIVYSPVMFGKNVSEYYQLFNLNTIVLSEKTLVGINPFDFSEKCDFVDEEGNVRTEIYKCPNGDTIGLNLLSELFVITNSKLQEYDLFESKQKIGIKRGLLIPTPVYLCSPAFRDMIIQEKLVGFEFEVVHIVNK